MVVIGSVCGDIEFELNCWKLWVIFGRQHFGQIKVLGLFG